MYDDDNMKEMFSNEARVRNLTYKSNIFCNIGVHFIFHGESEDGKSIPPKTLNFEKINIGSIHYHDTFKNVSSSQIRFN